MAKNAKAKDPLKGAELILEYYQRPFWMLTDLLLGTGYDHSSLPKIRSSFWRLVPAQLLDSLASREYVMTYSRTIQAEMKRILERKSIAYWLHLFRRIGPGPTGSEKSAATVSITRTILEGAGQKHGLLDRCPNIAPVSEIGIERVMSGLLLLPEFKHERQILAARDQLVFVDFTPDNLREFYDLEKLAYEIWFCGALLRITGKGANLAITSEPPFVRDLRSDELNALVSNFDNRDRGGFTSSKAIVLAQEPSSKGLCVLPMWNADEVKSEELGAFYQRAFNFKFVLNTRPNFLWVPFPFREYFQKHLPYRSAFEITYGVKYDAFFSVIASLIARVPFYWIRTKGESFLRSQNRAYDGLFKMAELRAEIDYFLEAGCRMLGIDTKPTVADVDDVIGTITLTPSFQRKIAGLRPFTHAMIVPASAERAFIDYAGTVGQLFSLFDNVRIADESFKGALLEKIFSDNPSALPTKECRARDGTSKQIDYAIATPPFLIVLECKAVTRNSAIEYGDPRALRHRRVKVVEASLAGADEKAKWLAAHPRGNNYDISDIEQIVPIGISPFVEYIHSFNLHYWLTSDVPRVLTPDEAKNFLVKADLRTTLNRVPVPKASERLRI